MGVFSKKFVKLPLVSSKRSPSIKIGESFLLEGEVSFSEEKFSTLLAGLVASVHSFKYLLNTYMLNTVLSTGYISVYRTDKTPYLLGTKILEGEKDNKQT